MKPQEIKLDHFALEEFREKLDFALQNVSKEMIRRGMQTGSVNAKIDIEIHEVISADGEMFRTMMMEPDIRIRIGSKEQIKCNKSRSLVAEIDVDGVVVAGDVQISMDEIVGDGRTA